MVIVLTWFINLILKDNKHIQSFGKFNENLNISDVRNSLSDYKQITRDELEQFEKDNYELEDTLEFTNDEIQNIKKKYDELTIEQQDEINDRTKNSIFSKPFTADYIKWYFKQSIPPDKRKYPFCYGSKDSKYTLNLITERSIIYIYKTKYEYFVEQLMYSGRNTNFFICKDFNGLINCLEKLIPRVPYNLTNRCVIR